MNKSLKDRIARLMPKGIPKYVRCYDNGGETADRYTVCYTGRAATEKADGYPNSYPFICMSESPFSPQGVGMHSSTAVQPYDTMGKKKGYNWPPAIGRKCRLGRRINFKDLPPDCQKAVIEDYVEIWGLTGKKEVE